MNKDVLKQILLDQKETYLNNPIIRREYALDDQVNYCFVGIRRTGKSYMMYQQIRQLTESGIDPDEILYVNFEDERLLEITTGDLNILLEIALETSGKEKKPRIFLDEIHNVDGWEKFVRRLADTKYKVSITGSNSKMLSKEIASVLGGRFMVVEVFPYSFQEYLHACNMNKNYAGVLSTSDRAKLTRTYEQYVTFGAFPELVDIRNKREYLSSVYQTIYLGDILTRNKITNDFALRLILKKIAESVMKPVSFSRLTNILKSAGASIGKQTVINYVRHIIDAYLLFTIQNYASKLVDKETSPKYYFMDTGLLGLLVTNTETAQLENLVAIHLIRRYGMEQVYYFEKNVEIDFYVPEAHLAIQVCFGGLENPETRQRELGAFGKLRNHIPDAECVVLTNSEEDDITYDGIDVRVIPVWKWMLLRL